jgi:hypothetical protein
MAFIKCSVDGCNARLQPIAKPLREKEFWVYRECDRCLRNVCEKHSIDDGEEVVCDRCRREMERPAAIKLIDLEIKPAARSSESLPS